MLLAERRISAIGSGDAGAASGRWRFISSSMSSARIRLWEQGYRTSVGGAAVNGGLEVRLKGEILRFAQDDRLFSLKPPTKETRENPSAKAARGSPVQERRGIPRCADSTRDDGYLLRGEDALRLAAFESGSHRGEELGVFSGTADGDADRFGKTHPAERTDNNALEEEFIA